MTTDVVDAPEIDTEQMSTDLAADLGLNLDTSNRDPADTAIDEAADTVTADAGVDKTAVADAGAVIVDDLPVPKSWAKEMHPIWDKLAKGVPLNADESKRAAKYYNERETQMAEGAKAYGSDAEYGRSLRGVISKHEDVLRAQGLDAPKAVDFLFNAHRQLSMGTKEQRQAYLGRVAASYGLELAAPAAADPNAQPPAALPPEVKAALERLDRLEGHVTTEQQQRFESQKAATAAEVNAFAADPKNPYFDECADHICVLLKGDPTMKLSVAYETAVWANPVTRQKELARIQQETDKANRERAQAAAKAAKKGTSPNVRGQRA